MAYEKYITRNGKVYGPYVYHSRRVDGKVVSEYCGPNGKKTKTAKKKVVKSYERKKETFPPKRQVSGKIRLPKLRLLAVFGMFAVLLLVLGLLIFPSQLTGKSIVDFEGVIVADKLTGNLHLTLVGGELIPVDSKLIIKNENLSYEFVLSELFKEETIIGDFFLAGSNLVGSGEGFGLLGKKEETPEVSFKILIEPSFSSGSGGEESEVEEPVIEENETVSTPAVNDSEIEEPVIEDNKTVEKSESNMSTEESVEEIVTEEIVEESVTEQPEIEEIVEELVVEESESEEPIVEEIETEETIEEPVIEESEPEEPVEEASPIGGILSNIFNVILTGRVVDEPTTIQGSVMKGEEFTYNIPAGAKATIVPGSVVTSSENLSEKDLTLIIEDGVLKVVTDYSKIETGFGEDYLTDEKVVFETNSQEEGIDLVEGSLEFSIEFNGSEIVNYKTNLLKNDSIEMEKNKTVPETAEEIFNKTNITIESDFVNVSLTEEEKVVLRREFKLIVVNTTASNYKDKVLVDFKLGDYSMSNSYDLSLSDSKIKELIEKDRLIWLKDLARELGAAPTVTERREDLDSLFPVM